MTDQPPPPAPVVPASPAAPSPPLRKQGASRIWVLVVLVLGILLGVLLALTVHLNIPPGGPRQFFLLSIERALQLHVILETIEMVLLVSLVFVYARIYSETRANFSMGILIVLFALLVHSILSYPLAANQIGPILVGSGPFFPYPDILTIIAYSIFLFLSLG